MQRNLISIEPIEAYEDILEILINLNYEQAAVILDEFRIH